MFTGWLSKGLLAFMLTFACATLAFGQSKSADLPVPQRINCIPPIQVGRLDVPEAPQTQLAQTIVDLLQASKAEAIAANVVELISVRIYGEGESNLASTADSLFKMAGGPLASLFFLFR